MSNTILDLLSSLRLISKEDLVPYAAAVRDRADIAVLRCRHSGVILLSRTDHIDQAYYEAKAAPERVVLADQAPVLLPDPGDTERRTADLTGLVGNRRWLDFGTGAGWILDALESKAVLAEGIEPNARQRQAALARGRRVHAGLEDAGDAYDVVTLFHVLEHLADPVGVLRSLAARMAAGATLVVEVPHARDFLLETLDCEAFRRFTLWSEHLVLHTRQSLSGVLGAAGFAEVTVKAVQRYPLANHLHWLRHGRPGGHRAWTFIDTPALAAAYGAALADIDQTDTLVAFARKA